MAKFTYRMQNILDMKLKLEDQEKIAFGIATANLEAEQEKLKEVMLRQAGYERQLKELATGTINISDIKVCKNAITSMKVMVRDQMIQVSKAQKALEAARKRLNDIMMERKMHEKLKEREFEVFLAEQNAMESKITDELVSYSYFNNDNGEE